MRRFISENGGTPLGHHVAWKASLRNVSSDDPTAMAHHEYSNILQTALCFDQLDASDLARPELVCRQLQQAEEKLKDRHPPFSDTGGSNSEAYFFSGLADARGPMVAPALSKRIIDYRKLERTKATKEGRKTWNFNNWATLMKVDGVAQQICADNITKVCFSGKAQKACPAPK